MFKKIFNLYIESEKKKIQNLPKLLAVAAPIWIALHLWERKLDKELAEMEPYIPETED